MIHTHAIFKRGCHVALLLSVRRLRPTQSLPAAHIMLLRQVTSGGCTHTHTRPGAAPKPAIVLDFDDGSGDGVVASTMALLFMPLLPTQFRVTVANRKSLTARFVCAHFCVQFVAFSKNVARCMVSLSFLALVIQRSCGRSAEGTVKGHEIARLGVTRGGEFFVSCSLSSEPCLGLFLKKSCE